MTGLQTLDSILTGPAAERFGWVLLHSIWQFVAVAVLAASALRLLVRASAGTRYWLLTISLGVAVLLPIGTWFWLAGDAPGMPEANATSSPRSFLETDSPPPLPSHTVEVPVGFAHGAPDAGLPLHWDLQIESAVRPWLS